MDNPLSVPSDPLQSSPALDYAFLRQEGIEYLARLAGKQWTDFNSHDPGITILEALCYALTDLGFRINYEMRDLLMSHEGDLYRSLFSPAKILTCNPVTATDLRKLVIDLDGVRNAWVERIPDQIPSPGVFHDPSDQTLYLDSAAQRDQVPIRGVCQVLIEIETDQSNPSVLHDVNERLHGSRSLCQDLAPPRTIRIQKIKVKAEIEIGAGEEMTKLHTQICRALADFISPRIRFYSLAEMRDRGKSIDEILDGPVLQHGFIDTGELESTERKTAIRVSDLIQLIMDLKGVVAVHSLTVALDAQRNEIWESWYLKLDAGTSPRLDDSSDIRLVRGEIKGASAQQIANHALTDLQAVVRRQPLPESQRDVLLDAGRDRQIERYYSVQHHLPAVYGIGPYGLPGSASDQRKAQARQLKAYLMFFEQILANYFSQIAHAKDLFSFQDKENGESFRTYFSQAVDDPDLNLGEIRVQQGQDFQRTLQNLTENPEKPNSEDPETKPDYSRINRFLNHLLARFSEQFTDYSPLTQDPSANVRAKRAFLREYDKSGAERGRAFNYTLPSWDTDNVSGLEKRISRKLGLLDYRRRALADLLPGSDQGGFHMVEHFLLRPRESDHNQGLHATLNKWQAYAFLAKPRQKDPYSAQLSFIFPKWIDRFKDQDFIAQTLREETPAHLSISIQWLAQTEMLAFESAFKDWLESLTMITTETHPIPNDGTQDARGGVIPNRVARDRLVLILGIGVPYPLRDLRLEYPEMVAVDQATKITILDGQIGVTYRLCDAEGNELDPSYEVQPNGSEGKGGVVVPTPKIAEDITFSIMAVREVPKDGGLGVLLETYLNELVAIKVGLNPKLAVGFQPQGDQVVTSGQLVVDYGENSITIAVAQSQEGVTYQLFGDNQNNESLSDTVTGTGGKIPLKPVKKLFEDTTIKIQADRQTAEKDPPILLDTELSINVRPDPDVVVNVDFPIVDYNGTPKFTLTGFQATANYELYRRAVTPEYVGNAIGVQSRELSGFVKVAAFAGGTVTTGNLTQDTLFIVMATKINNRETLQLKKFIAVFVRPSPDPEVRAESSPILAETSGMVLVNHTQKGVEYQLLNVDDTSVGSPGFDYRDRGVGTTRVGVDLGVAYVGEESVLLPTPALTKQTAFKVRATSIYARQSTVLLARVSIDVKAPPPSESSGGS